MLLFTISFLETYQCIAQANSKFAVKKAEVYMPEGLFKKKEIPSTAFLFILSQETERHIKTFQEL